MAYQIKQLAKLAGVSVRTLRYYDEIGLLPPAYIGTNGYRYYETAQVDQLQQIRLYRAMQVPLAEIKPLLAQSTTEIVATLSQQYQQLLAERQQLDRLLGLVQATIKSHQGGSTMTDSEKFAAFKRQQVAANTAEYGEELADKYDAKTIQQANQKFANLSADDYAAMRATEAQLLADLKTRPAVPSAVAARIYTAHKKWLSYSWVTYSAAMHRNLALMYQADDRFQAYYDGRAGKGASALLCQIIAYYAQA
ncbi:MerR family transcriptional regulator [Lactiplantibacillus sp. WILCCON 0030]|uniref:MerR family transcriptional regulator n=1 Tax=Lactiplantibacillus brownii TaxID=3069269 RepID=A0ABU1AB90_9LACO|nr:MerR family transcriptional regulator [Lactiplantibacillus brownii]MDQ7938131.1 MerR family transcriptional regulator [Lactiplantibacillus brownii]